MQKLESLRENSAKALEKMLAQAYAKLHLLNLLPGDYVYLDQAPKGKGHKLQPQ